MSEEEKKNKDSTRRVEIIFSQAVEEDIFEGFKEHKIGSHYSKVSAVSGSGFSSPKLGDAIWPQLNEMIIVYCKKSEAEKIVDFIKSLRKKYPVEGIACFVSKAKIK
ncbi:MAG: hypothetical protein J1E59_02325 [Treponema sp.]|nr:hypothetical protein [Treponema sp.]